MLSTVEWIVVIWCISTLFNAGIRWLEHDTGSEWDGYIWCMFIASLAFAPIVAVCNIVDEFPYKNLNIMLTSSMFNRRQHDVHI